MQVVINSVNSFLIQIHNVSFTETKVYIAILSICIYTLKLCANMFKLRRTFTFVCRHCEFFSDENYYYNYTVDDE